MNVDTKKWTNKIMRVAENKNILFTQWDAN